jgi:riboflavin kinase/FMN adenylyltransferase
MELIRGLRGLRARHRPCVATIGAFDGVHRGHAAVIGQLREQGAALGLPMTVVSFEPLPREYLQPEQAPARLSTLREKHELLAAQGVDRLLLLRFGEAVRQMGAEEFTREVLVDGLGVRSLIIGDDFRFGRARAGSTELMRELGVKWEFATLPTATVLEGEERVSSTRVRALLARGDFAMAERLLGRPYTLSGRVIHGRSLGRELGFPTANIPLRRRLAPLRGVYAVTVNGAGLAEAPAVANIGARPTVESAGDTMLEVHVLEGAPLLYGKRLTVTPRQRLREEQKFASIEALGAQISRDKEQAQQFFATQTKATTQS